MAYSKQTWADLPDTSTPITAARLAHIEDGIFNAAATADSAGGTAGVTAVAGRTGSVTLTILDIANGAAASAIPYAITAASVAAGVSAGTLYVLKSTLGAASGVATLKADGTLVQIGGLVTSINGLDGDLTLAAGDVGAASPADVAAAIANRARYVKYSGSVWPVRSSVTSDPTEMVIWKGGTAATPPAIGGQYAVNGLDVWWLTG